jgi:hypothetical protein
MPPTGPSVSPVRGAAEVDGRGLPIARFAGELPTDATLESPTPWVRSHVSCTGGLPADRIAITDASALEGTTELVGMLMLDAVDVGTAQRALRERAAALCADTITQVTVVPAQGEVHVTAIAVRHITTN